MKNNIDLSKDITFCERIDSDQSAIKITTGKYKDVIYTYGQVSVHENKELETCSLKFDYQVQEPVPSHLKQKDLEDSEEFMSYIGDVLTEIICEQLDEKNK